MKPIKSIIAAAAILSMASCASDKPLPLIPAENFRQSVDGKNVDLILSGILFDRLNEFIKLLCTEHSAHSEIAVKVIDVFIADILSIFAHNLGFVLIDKISVIFFEHCGPVAFLGGNAVSLKRIYA